MLISLPCSSANTRIEPDLMTNRPSAVSPALHTVSPNAKKRDCALFGQPIDVVPRERGEQVDRRQEVGVRGWFAACVSMVWQCFQA